MCRMTARSGDIRRSFLQYFETQGHRIVAQLVARPDRRPTLLFTNAGMNQFKDVFLGREQRDYKRATTLAEVHAGQRQAQRSRQRRAVAPASHVLRDAGQLLVRRLLQGRRDPLRLDGADRGLGPAEGSAARLDLRRRRHDPARRRGVRHLEGHPRRRVAHRRVRRRRQLLADGRDRPVRPLLRDLLRPPRHGARARRRSADRGVEQRLHGVQPARRRRARAAAGPLDRHRHGPRAHHRGHPGPDVELRHRPVPADPRRHRRPRRRALRRRRLAGRGLDARRRRPPPRRRRS